MAVAATAGTASSLFRNPFCKNFPCHPHPSIGLSASSSPLAHRLNCTSSSSRPSPKQLLEQWPNSAMKLATGTALSLASIACLFPFPALGALSSFEEPGNALSLPTWAIHVSSVAEWVIAMALVWEYGERSGFAAWKGLSWGMVPLLGGAMCACTWHFFYNSESLEILVAIQGALTLVGNATMCIAAFRIFKAYEGRSDHS